MTLAAGCTAGTKRILRQMSEFAEQRVQFGKPIADFEITQRKLARTATDIYASDAMLGELARLAESPDGEYALEAACCKVFASEMLWRAADEMVQLAGGRGFVKPYPYERMLRDSRINRIFEGTNEILRLFIALNGIEEPAEQLQGARRRAAAAAEEPRPPLAASRRRASRRTLRRDADARRRAARAAAAARASTSRSTSPSSTDATRARSSARTARRSSTRQQELERLADMAIELFATACVLARTQRLLDERGEDAVRARARAVRPVRRRVGAPVPRERGSRSSRRRTRRGARGGARARSKGYGVDERDSARRRRHARSCGRRTNLGCELR